MDRSDNMIKLLYSVDVILVIFGELYGNDEILEAVVPDFKRSQAHRLYYCLGN